MSTPLRAGLSVAESVLGAGLLLMPPVAAGLAGRGAPAAWALQLGIGAAFCLALGLLAQARTGAGSLPDVVGRVLGGRAGDAVTALYLAGFTVGQAAVAQTAARLAAAGLGAEPDHALWYALLLPALAAGAAARGLPPSQGWRRVRLAATWAVALCLCARPAALAAAGMLPSGGARHWWAAAFLLLFAGVGWERVARVAPELTGRRRTAAAVLVAAAAVTAAYLLPVLWLRGAAAPGTADAPTAAGRAAALAAAALLAVYCATNVAAAGTFLTQLARRVRPAPEKRDPGPDRPGTRPARPPHRATGAAASWAAPAVVAAATTAVLAASVPLGWGVPGLLAGPAVATCAAYLLGAAAAVRAGPALGRLLAVPALAALATCGVAVTVAR
ncbi:hypothetical protein [Actinacidiphila sp. ITFR-21]|uniref:hypothetical protein n=1 Tax=Actinacidiphila sp. ITFR-21 TaxID=3075199 RepID=UPI002889A080|nr:hypothetical protein [Streptomyces sp. ITFR-21]WNI14315.1 hypothetical protein RLT57_01370 [Streptomyces sp. ITFR-21]